MSKGPYYEVFGLWEQTHPQTGEVYLKTKIGGRECYVVPNLNKLEPKQPDWLLLCKGHPASIFRENVTKFCRIFRRRVPLPIDETERQKIKL